MNRFVIYFDGGCKPNPGRRYGSWEAFGWNFIGQTIYKLPRRTVQFGLGTNNEAEWLSLQSALTDLHRDLTPYVQQNSRLEINTDSKIVHSRLDRQDRRTMARNLVPFYDECLRMLSFWKEWAIVWESRCNNLARFGH